MTGWYVWAIYVNLLRNENCPYFSGFDTDSESCRKEQKHI